MHHYAGEKQTEKLKKEKPEVKCLSLSLSLSLSRSLCAFVVFDLFELSSKSDADVCLLMIFS